MGKGKKWKAQEAADLAKSYVAATCDPIVGRDQTSAVFFNKVYNGFVARAPQKVDSDTYGGRSANAVMDYFKKKIQKDTQKFNRAVRTIRLSNPTGGLTEQQKLNMAVAIFVGVTDKLNYRYKDFPAEKEWVNFKAWQILRKTPKFSPNLVGRYSQHGCTGKENPRPLGCRVVNGQTSSTAFRAADESTPLRISPRPTLFSTMEQEGADDDGSSIASTKSTGGADNLFGNLSEDDDDDDDCAAAVSTTALPLEDNQGSDSGEHEDKIVSIETPASVVRRPKGRDRAKRDEEKKRSADQMLKGLRKVGAEMAVSNERGKKSLALAQVKLYYDICKADGDEEGRKKAKQSLRRMIDLHEEHPSAQRDNAAASDDGDEQQQVEHVPI